MKTTDRLIGILDSEQENQRLELVIESDENPKLALRLVTYSKGLGWHTQKTIYIENSQAEELQFLLGGARSLLKQSVNNTTSNNLAAQKVQNVESTKFKVRTFPLSQKKSA